MSLRWRIALALAAVAGVVSVLAATGAYVSTSRQLHDTVDETLIDKAADRALFGRGRLGGPPPPRGGWCPEVGRLHPLSVVQRIAADGEVDSCIAGSATLPIDARDLAIARAGGPARLRTVSVDGTRYRVLTVSAAAGAIQLARDLDEIDEVLGRLRTRLAVLTAGCVALAGVLGWLVARRIVRPVIELRDTAESITDTQDLTTPIPTGGPGEIGSLAQSFTTMVQALATSREQQQRLITDASHEMRTPLTSLRTNLELLDYLEQLPAAERAAILAAVQDDVGELTNLLTELVELATDQLSSDEAPEEVLLADLARDVAVRAARRSGCEIAVADAGAGAGATVTVRPQMLERAISNLVDNAVKYSPDGSSVEVVVDGGRLEVRDHGPGIGEEDQPHIFDRFYRSTTARAEPGSGLGLAIVKQIVQRHHGAVWARNHADGGAVVGFEVPTSSRASYTELGRALHGAPIIGSHG
jgi:two-component system sensor histidine kinase MprB